MWGRRERRHDRGHLERRHGDPPEGLGRDRSIRSTLQRGRGGRDLDEVVPQLDPAPAPDVAARRQPALDLRGQQVGCQVKEGLREPLVDEEPRRGLDVVLGHRAFAADADGTVEEAFVERGQRDRHAVADRGDPRAQRVPGHRGGRRVRVRERTGFRPLEPAWRDPYPCAEDRSAKRRGRYPAHRRDVRPPQRAWNDAAGGAGGVGKLARERPYRRTMNASRFAACRPVVVDDPDPVRAARGPRNLTITLPRCVRLEWRLKRPISVPST